MNDSLIFDNFVNYNLPFCKDYYLYDLYKFDDLDYINSFEKLRNLYRSFMALNYFTKYDNFALLQSASKEPEIFIPHTSKFKHHVL
jgi:hypothetical protein